MAGEKDHVLRRIPALGTVGQLYCSRDAMFLGITTKPKVPQAGQCMLSANVGQDNASVCEDAFPRIPCYDPIAEWTGRHDQCTGNNGGVL